MRECSQVGPSLLPPKCQDLLNNSGSDALEVISSADKETEIVILHLIARRWSADKEGTIKNNIIPC